MQAFQHSIAGRLPSFYLVNRWVELAVVAVLFTLALLLFTKWTRLLPRVRRARQQMVAAAYEILLYRRSPRMVLRAQCRCIWNNLKLLYYLSPGLLFGALLFALSYNVLSDRYGYAPAPVGSPIVVSARLSAAQPQERLDVQPQSEQVRVSGHVHVASISTTWTRLQASSAGMYLLRVGNERAAAKLNVDLPNRAAVPSQCLNKVVLHIGYAPRNWWGMEDGWVIYFLVVCVIAGIPIARRI